MNKNELIAKLAEQTQMTKADCQRVIEATIEIARKTVQEGGELRLVGFGTFLRSKRSARRGRNPQTGEEMLIDAQWVPRFRAGKEFKEIIQ